MTHSHTSGYTCLGIINDTYDVAFGYVYEHAGNIFTLNIAIRDKDFPNIAQHSLLHYDLSRLSWATFKGFSEAEAIEQFENPKLKKEVEEYLLEEVIKRLEEDLKAFNKGKLKDKDRIPV